MVLDVLKVHRVGYVRQLVELARVRKQVRVLGEAALVALEVAVVHGVEAHQRREEAPVGLGDRVVADEVALAAEQLLELVECREQLGVRLLVRGLARREAGAVDAVVDGVVDALVDGVDGRPQRLGVVVVRVLCRRRRHDVGELAVEHANDLGRLVVDDGRGLLVPQHRHRHAPGVVGVGLDVQLVQAREAVHRVADDARVLGLVERPRLGGHVRRHDTEPDRMLEAFEFEEEVHARRPRTSEANVDLRPSTRSESVSLE